MSVTLTKLFHPLTGVELHDTIINDFGRALAGHQMLAEHLTYPSCTIKVRLEIMSYPMDSPIIVEYERALGETQETAPDAIREENNLPTFRTERAEDTGQLTDVPQRVKTVVSVGKGTIPRGKPAAAPAKAKQAPSVPEVEVVAVLLDDDGNEVKANSF